VRTRRAEVLAYLPTIIAPNCTDARRKRRPMTVDLVGRTWQEKGFRVLFPEQQRGNNANLCFNWFEPGDIRHDAVEAL